MAVPGTPGAPNLFRPETASRNLNRIYTPQTGGFEMPVLLGGIVNLTHDFLGTVPYLATSIFDNVGLAGVAQILSAINPPDGYIWIIDEMSVQCTDPLSREMSLRLRYPTSLGTFVVTLFRVTTGVLQLAFPVGRRLIIPPVGQLDLSVNAIAAGENLRWTIAYFQLPAGQFCPKS